MVEISCKVQIPASSDIEALDKLYEVLTAAGFEYSFDGVCIHET